MSLPFVLPKLFITSLVFFLFLTVIRAQREDFKLEVFQEGRIFFWDNDAPLTKEIAKIRPAVDAAKLVLSHFARVERAIVTSLRSGRAPGPEDVIRPCNARFSNFPKSAQNHFGVHGLPDPDGSCVSDVRGTNFVRGTTSGNTINDIYETLLAYGTAVSNNIKPIARAVITNFTNPAFVYNCPYDTPSQRCSFQFSSGIRLGSNWHLQLAITNAPKNAQLSLFKRQYITEYPRIIDGTLQGNALMRLRVRPKEDAPVNETQTFRTDATTAIGSFRGPAAPSSFETIVIEDNPAILDSLDLSDLFVQQAEDALSPSSIAILFLPLFLNLVPIALLANVSTITMLLYTLLSDVLTVIPLLIKGIELITIGLQTHRSVLVRMTTARNGTVPNAAAAGIYASECRAKDNILPTGIAFVVISLVFLVGGIGAEVLAQRYAKKQRMRRLGELQGVKLGVSSRATSAESAKAISARRSNSASLASIDSRSLGLVGSPFNMGSYHESYNYGNPGKTE